MPRITRAWSGLAGERPLFAVAWASRSSAAFGGLCGIYKAAMWGTRFDEFVSVGTVGIRRRN
jgi:hypothetical protein